MKLLFLTSAYPPFHLGGYELSCPQTATRLKSGGHEVRILTSRSHRSVAGREEGVYRSLWPQADLYYYRPLDFFLHRRSRERANLEGLARVLQEYSPQLVMVWGMWNLSIRLPELLERRMPGRVVYYLASYWPADQDLHTQYWQSPARRWWTELLKKSLRMIAFRQLRSDGYPPRLRFERSICCSRFVRSRLVASGKVPESAQVIYLSIPTDLGGIGEWLEDENWGFLIEPFRTHLLANRIQWLWGNPSEVRRMGAKGREFVGQTLNKKLHLTKLSEIFSGLRADGGLPDGIRLQRIGGYLSRSALLCSEPSGDRVVSAPGPSQDHHPLQRLQSLRDGRGATPAQCRFTSGSDRPPDPVTPA